MQIFIEVLGIAGVIIGVINAVLAVVDDDYIAFVEWVLMILFIILSLSLNFKFI